MIASTPLVAEVSKDAIYEIVFLQFFSHPYSAICNFPRQLTQCRFVYMSEELAKYDGLMKTTKFVSYALKVTIQMTEWLDKEKGIPIAFSEYAKSDFDTSTNACDKAKDFFYATYSIKALADMFLHKEHSLYDYFFNRERWLSDNFKIASSLCQTAKYLSKIAKVKNPLLDKMIQIKDPLASISAGIASCELLCKSGKIYLDAKHNATSRGSPLPYALPILFSTKNLLKHGNNVSKIALCSFYGVLPNNIRIVAEAITCVAPMIGLAIN